MMVKKEVEKEVERGLKSHSGRLSNEELIECIYHKIPVSKIAQLGFCSVQAVHKRLKFLKKNGFLLRNNNSKYFFLTLKGEALLVKNNKIKKINDGCCEVCGYKLVLHGHHIDGDRKNNHYSNLILLCPNHHYLIHEGLATLERKEDRFVYSIKISKDKRFLV